MALITINGVALPTPSDYSIGIMDISKAERNANGYLILERIATKKKIQVKYNYLTNSDLAEILNLISPTSYSVTYLDPLTNKYITSQFYCGDRNMGLIDFVDNNPRYRDLSFDLIER